MESRKITGSESDCISRQEMGVIEYGTSSLLILGVAEETEDVDDWAIVVSKPIEDNDSGRNSQRLIKLYNKISENIRRSKAEMAYSR